MLFHFYFFFFFFKKDEWQLLANSDQRRPRKTVLKFGDNFAEKVPKRRRARDDSSSDESHFRKKEAKKVEREKKRSKSYFVFKFACQLEERRGDVMPLSVGEKGDIDPVGLDKSIGFDCVGGLDSHVNSLKELVLLPLLYPEIFARFAARPPRGVLFHGPPGTGKTLVAKVNKKKEMERIDLIDFSCFCFQALANSCMSNGKKVSFFYRKGADVLSKWVGEAGKEIFCHFFFFFLETLFFF